MPTHARARTPQASDGEGGSAISATHDLAMGSDVDDEDKGLGLMATSPCQ